MIPGSIKIDPKTGRWRGRYRLAGHHRSWTPEPQPKTQRQADRMLAEYLRGLETGQAVPAAKDTVEALADRWFRANLVRWKGQTPRTYRSLLDQRILPQFGDERAQALTPEAVEDWRDRLLVELPAGTVATLMRLLSAILAQAVERRVLSRNVAAIAVSPRLEKIERQVPSIEWCETVLLPFLNQQGPLGWPLLLIYETGLRSGELRALRKREDVDLEAGLLHVRYSMFRTDDGKRELRDPKTKRSVRVVPLTERAIGVIRKQLAHVAKLELKARAWADNGLLFPGLLGAPMDDSTLLGEWRRLQERLGEQTSLTVHDLRHLANTAMERAGVSAERRALVLGHSRVSMTIGTYTHHHLESIRDIAGTMNRSRRAKPGRKRGGVPQSVPPGANEAAS